MNEDATRIILGVSLIAVSALWIQKEHHKANARIALEAAARFKTLADIERDAIFELWNQAPTAKLSEKLETKLAAFSIMLHNDLS